MNRFATLLVCLLMACDEGASTPAPSRVVAVASSETAGEDVDTFCEVSGATAPAFQWPASLSAEPTQTGWRWVNVWATWCRPCVEELPRIGRFRQRLADDGIEVSTVFINADADDAALASFVAEHAELAGSPRVPSTDGLRQWLRARGLDEGAPLPVHFFVRGDGTLACARTAAIGEDDYASVRRLLEND